MTERIYYSDPTVRTFDAQLLSLEARGAQFAAVLDRTAFYAEGGGQLYDTGTLSDGQATAQVLSVQDANGDNVHLLDRALAPGPVRGHVLWERRHDLTQQHTGQHILSQAFYQACHAETVSVHMTEANCTLDLARVLTPEQHAQAEELANQIAQEDRPVMARFVDDEELARLPLRRPPAAKHQKIRVVEIKDFDWSACGGTHVPTTGAVGMIKVLRAERRGNEQRIEFTCGMRALRDYGWKSQALQAMASQFTVKDSELAGKVQGIADENKDLRRQLNFAKGQLTVFEAERLWAAAAEHNGTRVVAQVFSDRATEDARLLAMRLKAKPGTVVLFAVAGEKPGLIFARAANAPGDMGRLLREVSAAFGGRGGGQPEMAQGGVAPGSDLARAVQMAVENLR
ncbi:MAG: hypothetical protein HZB53_08200 [Chloroflexi bacterium]|nr:hypothetical protein [Chloroflexota bacterium]